jgi:hypothetical protein
MLARPPKSTLKVKRLSLASIRNTKAAVPTAKSAPFRRPLLGGGGAKEGGCDGD